MGASDQARGAGRGAGEVSGATLRRMLAEAAAALELHAAAIDAINVFPVPDGDTGANLAATLRAVTGAMAPLPADASAGAVLEAGARGALTGARGNSGVILSQWLLGLARSASGAAELNRAALEAAFKSASEAAWAALAEPREGTMLSVAAALAAPETHSDASMEACLAEAVARAQAAVARTPEQLPVLAAAGVVDAGALGLSEVVAGMLRGLRGEQTPPTLDAGRIDAEWARTAVTEELGFCLELLVSGRGLEAGRVREQMVALGESVVVGGDGDTLHIHVHTDAPEAVVAAAAVWGEVSEVKADDLSAQTAGLGAARGPLGDVAVVAVVSGEGFRRLFRDLGVAAIVPGGATMNPSTEAIWRAARSAHAADVLVLPNHANVAPAARQAAALAAEAGEGPRLHVVTCDDQPAGVAALMALELGAPAAELAERMSAAAAEIATGSVTLAARATSTPVALAAGQPFALAGDDILGGAESVGAALGLLVRALVGRKPGASLLTLYAGEGLDPAEAEAAARELGDRYHGELDVELVIGGQPHYPWVVSLE